MLLSYLKLATQWLQRDSPCVQVRGAAGLVAPVRRRCALPQPEEQGGRLPNGTAGHADLGSPGAQHHGKYHGLDLPGYGFAGTACMYVHLLLDDSARLVLQMMNRMVTLLTPSTMRRPSVDDVR